MTTKPNSIQEMIDGSVGRTHELKMDNQEGWAYYQAHIDIQEELEMWIAKYDEWIKNGANCNRERELLIEIHGGPKYKSPPKKTDEVD